jgi:hypothetical protein
MTSVKHADSSCSIRNDKREAAVPGFTWNDEREDNRFLASLGMTNFNLIRNDNFNLTGID